MARLTPGTCTLQHKIDELRREVKFRTYAYPHFVANKKLNIATAQIRITILKSILADYLAQQRKEDQSNGNRKEEPDPRRTDSRRAARSV